MPQADRDQKRYPFLENLSSIPGIVDRINVAQASVHWRLRSAEGCIQLSMSEYIAALTEMKSEVMQFRRFVGYLRASDLSRRLFALAIEIERLAQEMDSAKALEVVAADLLDAARKIPPGSERHNVLRQVGKLRIKLDALVSEQKKLPLCPSCDRGHEI